MRVLVTGGAGFIGSHLVGLLLDRGDEVAVLDDLSTGSLANLESHKDRPGFLHRVGSADDPATVADSLDGCDAAVHLAAAVGVRLIVDRPVHTIRTNFRTAEVVFEAAAQRSVAVFLASTSEVYGKSEAVPFREHDDLRLGPTSRSRWSYACSKALDEWLALAYHRECGLPVVIGRLFNAVGPRQVGRYGMVLPNLVSQALRGHPLTVFGSGEQTRCFAHVTDVVQAIAGLLDCPRAVGEVVNIGSDREISILELARRVKERLHSSSPIIRVPYEEAYAVGFEDMQRRVPDIGKLRGMIGWRPRCSLDQIIDDVAEDLRRRPAPDAE